MTECPVYLTMEQFVARSGLPASTVRKLCDLSFVEYDVIGRSKMIHKVWLDRLPIAIDKLKAHEIKQEREAQDERNEA